MVRLHDAVQNGIGDGGVANPCMPVLNRQLACDDGCFVTGPVVDDLQQIRARHAINRPHTPIVEDQYVRFCKLNQPLAKAAAAVPDAQFFLQAGYALI